MDLGYITTCKCSVDRIDIDTLSFLLVIYDLSYIFFHQQHVYVYIPLALYIISLFDQNQNDPTQNYVYFVVSVCVKN